MRLGSDRAAKITDAKVTTPWIRPDVTGPWLVHKVIRCRFRTCLNGLCQPSGVEGSGQERPRLNVMSTSVLVSRAVIRAAPADDVTRAARTRRFRPTGTFDPSKPRNGRNDPSSASATNSDRERRPHPVVKPNIGPPPSAAAPTPQRHARSGEESRN